MPAQNPVVPPAPDDTTPTTSVAGPTIAADEDVIEKEWVDRAKKVVNDTKDDPYERSNQVTALQSDYQQKRFGRGTKAA